MMDSLSVMLDSLSLTVKMERTRKPLCAINVESSEK
jgi:hypothetical protein